MTTGSRQGFKSAAHPKPTTIARGSGDTVLTTGKSSQQVSQGVDAPSQPTSTIKPTVSRHSQRKRTRQHTQPISDEDEWQKLESEDENRPSKLLKELVQPQEQEATAAISEAVSYMAAEVQTGTLSPTLDSQRIMQNMRAARLGGAYLTGFGSGHVEGVVEFGQSHNNRTNPRELDEKHVEDLARVFQDPSTMRDWETPIIIELSRSIIDPNCLREIQACNPHEPGAKVPPLKLSDPFSKEIAALEFACQYRQGGQLDKGALELYRARLAELLSKRPKAHLINGNHRIAAIVSIGAQCSAAFQQVLLDLQHLQITPEDAAAKVENIATRAKMARYRVEVFDRDLMHDDLRHWLARNEGSRIAKGMGLGERAWSLANQVESWINTERQHHPDYDNPSLYNAAHNQWLKSIATTPSTTNPGHSKVVKKSGLRRGEWAGADAASRLLTEPFTMRMLLDTRNAREVYEHILKGTMASHLLSDASTPVTCRLWLSMRTLLLIFDIAKGEGFDEAEDFICSRDLITTGYEDARILWDRLHCKPQKTPEYMVYYTPILSNHFDTLYAAALDKIQHPIRGIEWSEGATILAMRRVFCDFGTWIFQQNLPGNAHHRLGISLKLFARLPSPQDQISTHSVSFYGTCTLPAKRWVGTALQSNSSYNTDAGLLVLEHVLSPYLPIWTLGAQTVGKSSNSSRWYQRSRGYTQIAMLLLDAPGERTVEEKLHTAICTLTDIRLRQALDHIQARHGEEIRALLVNCSVQKTSAPFFPVLKQLCRESPDDFPDQTLLQRSVTDARRWLQNAGAQLPPPSPGDINRKILSYQALDNLLPPEFFLRFETEEWLQGWNTSLYRRFQNVNSLFGWAIFTRRLNDIVNEYLSEDQPTPGLHISTLSTPLGNLLQVPNWGAHINHPNHSHFLDPPTSPHTLHETQVIGDTSSPQNDSDPKPPVDFDGRSTLMELHAVDSPHGSKQESPYLGSEHDSLMRDPSEQGEPRSPEPSSSTHGENGSEAASRGHDRWEPANEDTLFDCADQDKSELCTPVTPPQDPERPGAHRPAHIATQTGSKKSFLHDENRKKLCLPRLMDRLKPKGIWEQRFIEELVSEHCESAFDTLEALKVERLTLILALEKEASHCQGSTCAYGQSRLMDLLPIIYSFETVYHERIVQVLLDNGYRSERDATMDAWAIVRNDQVCGELLWEEDRGDR
ncbi:hypothetical protein FRC12_003778 [Ceratobasidium sp. 428]|nr:hypothetical protein FRC12_003778 [Ceratobasidium sp. 428]